MQLSDSVCNARLDAIADEIGGSPVLQIFSGPPPLDCSAPDSGNMLAAIQLPQDWMMPAADCAKEKAGTWSGYGKIFGTAGHYRIKDSSGTCHIQGTVTATAGGGDMTISSMDIALNQVVTINTFSLIDANG